MKRETISLNAHWRFMFNKMPDDRVYRRDYDDTWWTDVCLPHTVNIEPHDVLLPAQGQCWYRRRLFVDEALRGKLLYLTFEGAMQEADVYINGERVCSHAGGYLPFVVDITACVTYGADNSIAVYLQNLDNPDIPPGKSSNKLDFQYFGGLYRNVYLTVCDKLHITDPILRNKVADGGIFVRYETVSEDSADVLVSVNVQNEHPVEHTATLAITLLDREGGVVLRQTHPITIASGRDTTVRTRMTVLQPRLWSPADPYLYSLRAEIVAEGGVVDAAWESIGIRHIRFTREGFFLNGERCRLTGANRHQSFPHLGNAVSDEAHAREMQLLKDGGFNFLRLCHYPQSPAVYDACDRLGILVLNCTPGWQWCREQGPFRARAYRNIREMVRRDRNHPCVILWEVSLNETGATEKHMWNDTWSGADDDFMHYCHLIAHEEYVGNQMVTSGDTTGREDPVFVGYDVPYCHEGQPAAFESGEAEKPFLVREYGDFRYGFHFSTTRRERKHGASAMLHSAWNFAHAHNANQGRAGIVGDAIWVGIDYTRPYFFPEPICAAGVLDIFRVPKFAYYYFASQQNEHPVLFIADDWAEHSDKQKVVVFSNCEQVELRVGGRTVACQRPDNGEDTPYSMPPEYQAADYWQGDKMNMTDHTLPITKRYDAAVAQYCFDGGNCRHIDHPPFTFFDVPYANAELTAIGYQNGVEVTRDTRVSNPVPHHIAFAVAEQGIPLKADGVDFVFVYATIVDRDEHLCPEATNAITFRVAGGDMVGRTQLCAEAGIAPVMVRKAVDTDKLILTAVCDLGSFSVSI